MLILAVAALLAAQSGDYRYHFNAAPGTPISRIQTLCKKFEAAKSERQRRTYVPDIKKQFSTYQGDKDELMLRCERRVQFR
jgi:hypothetical protein